MHFLAQLFQKLSSDRAKKSTFRMSEHGLKTTDYKAVVCIECMDTVVPSHTEIEGHSGNPGGIGIFMGCSSLLWDSVHDIVICMFVSSCVRLKVPISGF